MTSPAKEHTARHDGARAGLPPERWDFWDGTPLPGSPVLRWGYTTGACAAAVLTASFLEQTSGRHLHAVSLFFNDRKWREVPLLPPLPEYAGYAVIRKNGGDDPDSTHGALLYGRLSPASCGQQRPEDYLLSVSDAQVILRAVGGIGRVTREGLDCDTGRWAITRGPRRMISENIRHAGLDKGVFLAEIGVVNGEELARSTLNPHLGVRGGISILGTTGLVRPYSNSAYEATIRLCVRSCKSSGCRTMLLCTGGRSEAAARDWAQGPAHALLRDLPDAAFTCIADFIGTAIRAAAAQGMERVIICCMPGKLLKYAAGMDYTHAHTTAQDMPLLADCLLRLYPAQTALARRIRTTPTVRESLSFLDDGQKTAVLSLLAKMALASFAAMQTAGGPQPADGSGPPGQSKTGPAFGVLLTDFAGHILNFYSQPDFTTRNP